MSEFVRTDNCLGVGGKAKVLSLFDAGREMPLKGHEILVFMKKVGLLQV